MEKLVFGAIPTTSSWPESRELHTLFWGSPISTYGDTGLHVRNMYPYLDPEFYQRRQFFHVGHDVVG